MILPIGRILANRYRIEEFRGKGGMAEVYRAVDLQRNSMVAIKVLNEDLAQDLKFLKRFRREAQTLANLEHPNIVRFYELMESDGLVYMVMEYAGGQTLRSEISTTRRPFNPLRILEIMRPVCAALGFAHSIGYVHCDVKPANIMYDAQGNIKLADFGIAHLSGAASSMASTPIGTPAYMAPEQVRGLSTHPTTDVYALGVILFEMVTGGERPFTGAQAQIRGLTGERVHWEQLNLKAPSPRCHNPAISPTLESVILRCLEKEPSRRFTNPAELLATLDRALRASQMETATETDRTAPGNLPVPQPSHPRSRGKLAALWVLLVGIVLLVLAVAFASMGGFQPSVFPPRTKVVSPTSIVVAEATIIPRILSGIRIASPDESRQAASNSNITTILARSREFQQDIYTAEDYNRVGRVLTFTVDLISSEPLIWDTGWCATTLDILAQNVQHMRFDFYIENQLIPAQWIMADEYQNNNLYCQQVYLLINGWQVGVYNLKTVTTFNVAINDGMADFSAGTMTDLFLVTVK
jgi:serine/threonine protein kinase